MATVGPALYPGPSTFPGSTTYPGGGPFPQVEVLYSTDAPAVTPSWTYVAPGDLRGYTVSRGRQSELDEIDAGTCQIVLSNRARLYDPNTNVLLRPTNRWWIRAKHSGGTEDRFVGYADSYQLSWPQAGQDSVTVVSCTDELKRLNLDALPVTSPPRDTYTDVVMSDVPLGYWQMKNESLTNEITATVGDGFTPAAGTGYNTAYTDGPVVGDLSETGFFSNSLQGGSGWSYVTDNAKASENPMGDTRNLTGWAAELWINMNTAPPGSYALMASPLDAGVNYKWQIQLDATRAVKGWARNNAGTVFTVTSAALPTNAWHHIVWTLEAGTLKLYIDGASAGSTAWTGPVSSTLNTSAGTMTLGTGEPAIVKMAQLAWYQTDLSAARVAAHYAAAGLGYPAEQAADRINRILDDVRGGAPRSVRASSRSVQTVRKHGQPPLEEIRRAKDADNVDAVFFCSRSGVLTFLDAGHRGVVPWSTSFITFDDDGTDLRYLDATEDLSESFLFNYWIVSREDGQGVAQVAQDAASIAANFQRVAQRTLHLISDSDANNIAAALLAKYKDPLNRIPSVQPDMSDPDTALSALQRELGERIAVVRRPLGGGAAILQQPWIQQIDESAVPGEPIRLTFNVSPV